MFVCLEADATLVGSWCVHPAPRLRLPAQAAAALRDGRRCVRVSGGERRCASLCCFSKTVGLGFVFFPDQKFIAAVIQTAHKAFFNMCKYLHFAVVLLYREQPLP